MTLIDPVRFTPVALENLDLGFSSFPDVQPFSARAGIGYQELLESMRRYITRVLVPYLVDVNPQALWDGNVDKLMVALDAAIVQSQTEIDAALAAQKAQVAQNLADTLAQIVAGESAALYDAQVYAALESAGSTALALLDGRYATATWEANIQSLIDSGRLSGSALDAAYIFTDDDLKAIITNVASGSRVLLDSLYGQRVQFRLSSTALQFQYVGDTTWTDLVQLADITGPAGPTGNPGGVAELAYAEITTTFTVPIDSTNAVMNDVTGLTMSFVMPSRPVLLELGATVQYVGTSTLSDPYLRIIETTGGASTVLEEVHIGKQGDSTTYEPVFARRRITGTAGATRTFKVVAVGRSNTTWKVAANPNYPTYVAAYQC